MIYAGITAGSDVKRSLSLTLEEKRNYSEGNAGCCRGKQVDVDVEERANGFMVAIQAAAGVAESSTTICAGKGQVRYVCRPLQVPTLARMR